MAGRAYTAEEKAAGIAQLAANDGNIKRTARELDLPVSTVRHWKKETEQGVLPAKVQEALPAAVESSVEEMSRVRDLTLGAIEAKVASGDAKLGELNAVFGTLSDKIRLVQGLPTDRREVVSELPDASAFARTLGNFLGDIVAAAHERHGAIEDADFEEQAEEALPELTP